MPGYVGDQSNTPQLVQMFSQIQADISALQQQLVYLTGQLINLPVSDPLVAGQFWNNGGVVNVSAG